MFAFNAACAQASRTPRRDSLRGTSFSTEGAKALSTKPSYMTLRSFRKLATHKGKLAAFLWARNCNQAAEDAFFAQEAEEQDEQDAILAQEAEELWAQKEEHAIFAQEA